MIAHYPKLTRQSAWRVIAHLQRAQASHVRDATQDPRSVCLAVVPTV